MQVISNQITGVRILIYFNNRLVEFKQFSCREINVPLQSQ